MPERTTSRWAIPYPELPDGPPDIPDYLKRRALILDTFAKIDHGNLASRPTSSSGTPGIATRLYLTEGEGDSPRLDIDNGTGWTKIGPYAADAAANVASLRTLGRTATQAMPGSGALLMHEVRIASFSDAEVPPTGVDILGSISIALADGQTAKLLGTRTKCTDQRSSVSTFKVSTDAASLGTLADVAGLLTVQPSEGPYADRLADSPLTLHDRTEVALRIITAGDSLGIKFGFLIEYGF